MTLILVKHADILAQDAPRFHAAVRRHLNLETQHPIDLPALLRCQGIEGAGSHFSVRRENAVRIPFKSLQHFLTTSYSRKLPFRRRAGLL